MQLEWYISGGVRQIETDVCAGAMSGCCDLFQVVPLSRVIIDATEHDECNAISLLFNDLYNIFCAERILSGAGRYFDNSRCGIETMPAHLAFHGVLIAWKSARFHYDFEAFCRRAVKRHHHQVQVGGQGVHHDYLLWQGSDQSGCGIGQEPVVVHPGHVAAEMAFHTVFGPVIEFAEDSGADAFGLQPERVAAEIEAIFPQVLWENKLIAVNAQRVLLVGLAGADQGVIQLHGGWAIC